MAIKIKDPEEVISEINVTPLVDIMLVIFIVFLIAISAVKINPAIHLPKEVNQLKAPDAVNVNITIDQKGTLFLNNQAINENQLANKIEVIYANYPNVTVHVSGDENAKYEYLSNLIKICQKVGIKKLSFITEIPTSH